MEQVYRLWKNKNISEISKAIYHVCYFLFGKRMLQSFEISRG